MATGFWGRSRRAEEQQRQDAADTDLSRRAGTALVEADERLRITSDELGFAVAELGEPATASLREAVSSVRHHLGEAFALHQLNTDAIPDTPQELRERNARIVQLATWAQDLLEERTNELQLAVEKVRQAPAVVESVIAEAAQIRLQLPQTRETVTRLAQRYSEEALRQVVANADEADQLLTFAEHSLAVAARRRDIGRGEQSTLALEAATESVRRAATLLDAVENYEIEALRAESTLAAVVADSRGDLITARRAPATPAVTEAAAALQSALDALPAPGDRLDPFAVLTELRGANSALDAAIATAVDRASRPIPSPAQLAHAIDDAERQLAVARDVIAGHRGYIGVDARTRLSEAERTLTDVHRYGSDDDSREQAHGLARRTGALASEALELARRDIEGARQGADEDWGDGGYGGYGRREGYGRQGGRRSGGFGGLGGGDMGGLIGGVLGGMVLGEVLEDFFD